MSIIDYLDAATALTNTLEDIGHGAYVREARDETAVIYAANMRRFVLLFDNGADVWATTDGQDVHDADRFDGPVEDDALTLLALWLASEVDPAAKAAHDAVAGLEDWESVVSDLSARRDGISGILLSCIAGMAQVDISFADDSLSYVSVDVDPTFPDVRIPPSSPHQVSAVLEAVSSDCPYLDAFIESLSSIFGITNYFDAIGEFSGTLEVDAAGDSSGAVISYGRDVTATVTGYGPWSMVDVEGAEVSEWDDWTQMVAHIMYML